MMTNETIALSRESSAEIEMSKVDGFIPYDRLIKLRPARFTKRAQVLTVTRAAGQRAGGAE